MFCVRYLKAKIVLNSRQSKNLCGIHSAGSIVQSAAASGIEAFVVTHVDAEALRKLLLAYARIPLREGAAPRIRPRMALRGMLLHMARWFGSFLARFLCRMISGSGG